MTRRFACLALSISAWCWLAIPASAHHSFAAEYDMKKPVEVHGKIVEVRLENPHSSFVLDVQDPAGKVLRWSFEAGTPSGMIRNGYRKGMIPPGTEVTIKGAGFCPGATVSFGNPEAIATEDYVSADGTEMRVSTPLLATSRPVTIRLSTATGNMNFHAKPIS